MTESVASFNIPEVIEEDFNNILYVDDEDSNLRVFDSVFSRYYNVFTVNNGKMAIKLLQQYDIQMIITDQKMPEMTGTDLLEATLEEFPDIIRIILTGFADIQAIIKAINKCSIYKYVTKPYENQEMKEVIEKGLEIYNMRKKKYNGSPFFAETGSNGASTKNDSNGNADSIGGQFIERLLKDIRPEKEYYEMFLENAISYQHLEEQSYFHKDFHINSDEESVKLYNLAFKIEPVKHSAMVYMHLKLKLREILEKSGNKIELIDILDELEKFHNSDEDYTISNFHLSAYNWQENKLEYLTKSQKMRVYKISHQFEEVKFEQAKNYQEGYQLYTIETEEPIMIYGWDYELNSDSSESDFVHNMNQIISTATNMPFDLQENQIVNGVKSISSNYKDFILYGLHITE